LQDGPPHEKSAHDVAGWGFGRRGRALPTDAQAATKKKVRHCQEARRAAVPRRHARPNARPQHGATLDDARRLALQSSAVLVQDQTTGAILLEKNPNAVLPIASITKLMTAMVALDAKPDLNETLAIGDDDVDTSRAPARGSRSAPNSRARKCCAWR
jgi:D-alanyl-D-alanine carboxypeptidase